jgi:hypothetical protein
MIIGKIIFFQNWATYLKARLNCSIPGDFPFFFDEIQVRIWSLISVERGTYFGEI